MTTKEDLQRKNKRLASAVFLTVFAMIGLAFASVPLYNLFCRVTGFGGTTQTAEALPETISERMVTVKFNGDVARDLFWDFKPDDRSIDVKLGQKGLTSFTAMNRTARPIAGTALYNVTPNKAGKYFHKIQCFCFDEQILQAGEKVHMPVMFFVDPAMADDPNMEDVKTITLSYSFFKTESQELEQALEAFYNDPDYDPGTAAGESF